MSIGLPQLAGPRPSLPPISAPLNQPQFQLPPQQPDVPVNVPPIKKRRRLKPGIALNRINEVKALWTLRDRRMDDDMAYYLMEDAEILGDGNLITRNTMRVMVDKAAQFGADAKLTINVIGPRDALHEQIQEVTSFCRYEWEEWDRRWQASGHSSLDHDMAWACAQRGWICARMQYTNKYQDGVPVKMRLFDAREVYPMFNEDGIDYIAHVFKQTIAQAISSYGEHEDAIRRAVNDTNQDDDNLNKALTAYVQEYYDDTWCAIYVQGIEVVPPYEHHYGRIPWFVALNNTMPVENTELDVTTWVPEKGPSIFHSIKTAHDYQNKMLSIQMNEVERQANPPMLHKMNPANKQGREEILLDPGVVNYIFTDEDVKPMYVGPQPAQAGPLMQALQEDVEKGGVPSSMWGVGGDPNQSGFAQSIAAAAGRLALQGVFTAMERIKSESLKFSLEIIRDMHDGPVGYVTQDPAGNWVMGDPISPEMIAQVGTVVRVSYKDISPRDKVAWANLAVALVKGNLVSRQTARTEYLDLDNPLREDELVLAEQIYNNEQFMSEHLMPAALAKWDPQRAQQYMQARAQAAANPQPQPGGPSPGGPPGPGPGLPQGALPAQLQPQPGGPLDLLRQALGSAAGGAGLQRRPGIPGHGALPVRLPVAA